MKTTLRLFVGRSALTLLLTLGLGGCEEQGVEPLRPTLAESCIICDDGGGWDGSSYVDSISEAIGEMHNAGLDSVLSDLEDAAEDGLLSADEALTIADPRVDEFLAAQDITVPAGAWEEVQEAIQLFQAGEDIVAAYATSDISAEAGDLVREILQTIASPDPRSVEEVEADLEEIKVTAQSVLSGEELDGLAAAMGVTGYSAHYWPEMLPAWDATLTYDLTISGSASNCGWKVLGGDVVGGAFGFLRGGWIGAAWGALIGSTYAVITSC